MMMTNQPMPTISMLEIDQAKITLDRLSSTAVRVLMAMSGYERGQWGECRAKAATIADRLECSIRTVRRSLAALRAAGLWRRVDRRMRWSGRVLTDSGRLVCQIVLGVKFHATKAPKPVSVDKPSAPPISAENVTPCVTPCVTAQQREGKADLNPREEKERIDSGSGSAHPKTSESIDPADYQRPRQRGRLTAATWDSLAAWLGTAESVSYARCKIAHRSYSGLVSALGRCREWRWYEPRIRVAVNGSDAIPLHPEQVIHLAIESARKSGARFGTVESSMAYIGGILKSCMRDGRVPS